MIAAGRTAADRSNRQSAARCRIGDRAAARSTRASLPRFDPKSTLKDAVFSWS